MQFGITIAPHIERWDLMQYAEELGYDRAWVPDSQMIWSDCYAILALAAVNTRRIQIGTGVAIAGTRIAPVTAHTRGARRSPCKRCRRSPQQTTTARWRKPPASRYTPESRATHTNARSY